MLDYYRQTTRTPVTIVHMSMESWTLEEFSAYVHSNGELPKPRTTSIAFTFEEHLFGDQTWLVVVADGLAITKPIRIPDSGRPDIPYQPEELACFASR